jgi:hypothetical protein
MQLNDIIKDLSTNPKYAHSKIASVGLLNFKQNADKDIVQPVLKVAPLVLGAEPE